MTTKFMKLSDQQGRPIKKFFNVAAALRLWLPGSGRVEHPKAKGCGYRHVLCALLLLALSPLELSAVRVIEAGAIPFTAFLAKADFDQRYPGQEVVDLSKLDPGWYVIYEHESLSYYFGPVLLESTGQDYLAQLTETLDEAVAQRPSIQDYRLELSYEPSQSSASSGATGSDASSGNPSGGYGSPPPPPPSIWSFFRRLFGL
jgi:hypothetical protein